MVEVRLNRPQCCFLRVCVCRLTLSAAAAYLSEHCSLTQPVESLLADQLQQLGLQALFQLTAERNIRQRVEKGQFSDKECSVQMILTACTFTYS